MTRPLAAVVMAAGLGTRMKSSRPKHLHPLLGRTMLDWVIEAVCPLGPVPLVVVCSPETRDELARSLPDAAELAVQPQPRGTGDAVAAARTALAGFDGDVLVVPGDSPLLTPPVLEGLVEEHPNLDVDLADLEFIDSYGISRLVLAQQAAVQRGVILRLLHPRAGTRRVFVISGLMAYLNVE